jgi:hypothetical protein
MSLKDLIRRPAHSFRLTRFFIASKPIQARVSNQNRNVPYPGESAVHGYLHELVSEVTAMLSNRNPSM